jgi:heme iron utilization protein
MNVMEPLKGKIQVLLASQKFAVLSTYGEGQPYANLVAFVHDETFDFVFFVTKSDTRKFRNLQQHPRVALLIENTSNAGEDIQNAVVLTIIGHAEPLEAVPKPAVIDRYIQKHPYLSDFVRSKTCVLVKVWVEQLIWVENFETVIIINNKSFQ